MSWTTAKMKDPKARDPRWYLKALYRDREIGLWTDPDPWEKYQMQVVDCHKVEKESINKICEI